MKYQYLNLELIVFEISQEMVKIHVIFDIRVFAKFRYGYLRVILTA